MGVVRGWVSELVVVAYSGLGGFEVRDRSLWLVGGRLGGGIVVVVAGAVVVVCGCLVVR